MAKKQLVAYVLINADWWNKATSLMGSVARATSQHIRVRGPLVSEEPQGIWMGDIPSDLFHVKDVSRPTMMRLLIPWREIVAIGMIDDPGGGRRLGFAIEGEGTQKS